MSLLVNRVVLVTGATSGLGAAATVCLSRLGCKVALVGRNNETLDQVFTQCTEAGISEEKLLKLPGDITQERDIKRIISETIWRYGKLDSLVNGAKVTSPTSIQDKTNTASDLIFNTNITALITLCREAVPHLIKSQGNIINVSSLLTPVPGLFSLGMADSAINHFTRSIAQELTPNGVRANSISTGVTSEIENQETKEKFEKFREECKLFLGESCGDDSVSDFVTTVAFLVSEQSLTINGMNLPLSHHLPSLDDMQKTGPIHVQEVRSQIASESAQTTSAMDWNSMYAI